MLLQDLSLNELACTPQVSPTATYQEIIQGKNMSLVIMHMMNMTQIIYRYTVRCAR